MSIEIIKTQINSFLNSDTPEVMAIKGKWGVGKTFFWKKSLIEAQKNKLIRLKQYSYVSLFGINSLEALKFSIFEQAIDKDLIGKEASIETFKSNADTLLKSLGRKSVTLFQNMPVVKNFGTAIGSISFLSLNKTIICIDDFERKGDKLSAKDVMGLISILKEQKDCKIVLILNDESFEKKAHSDYKLFREKCIDVELEFNPTPRECADIALGGDNSAGEVSAKLKEFTVKLSINNIRIIKKIERVANLLHDCLRKYEPDVLNQAFSTLTLLSLCYYTDDKMSPAYDFVKNTLSTMFDTFDDDKEETDDQKGWKALLRKYGYSTTDQFDLQIAKTVETGFIEENSLLLEADKLNSQFVATKSINSFRDSWQSFMENFDDNEDQLIQNIRLCISKNAKYIGPDGLNRAVKLFRNLSRDDIANATIEQYIEARKDEKELFDLSRYPFRGDISDQKINTDFDKIYAATKEKRSIKDVLKLIADTDGWGSEDEKILANATADEYYKLFKTEKGQHLVTYIDKCLQFGRFTNASETGKKIAQNAKTALEMIGKENRLNALRVGRFGIKVSKQ